MNYLELLKDLNPIQIIEFKNYLKENIKNVVGAKDGFAKIIRSEKQVHCCSNCQSSLWKNGKDKNNVQKYICPGCKLTRSETTDTITYNSKLSFEIWQEVIDNLIDGLSIRRIAGKLKIAKSTSFHLRHKILDALGTFVESIILSGEIEADEKYLKINLKGIKEHKMPRISKKRSSSAKRGISNHKVCVVTAIDESDNLVIKVTGLGPATTEMLKVAYKDRVSKSSTFITDSKNSYLKFCEERKIDLKQIPSGFYETEDYKNLSNINNVHSQLETWLMKFYGVSTKHIQKYLNWFSYILMMKRRYEYGQLEINLYKEVITNSNYTKISNISTADFPVDLRIAYGEYKFGIFA